MGRVEQKRTRIDPEIAGRLAALGYISGSGAPANAGIDPKDRIGIANDLHRAELLVDAGAFAKALPLLTRVTAAEPEISLAQLQLGVARVSHGSTAWRSLRWPRRWRSSRSR